MLSLIQHVVWTLSFKLAREILQPVVFVITVIMIIPGVKGPNTVFGCVLYVATVSGWSY